MEQGIGFRYGVGFGLGLGSGLGLGIFLLFEYLDVWDSRRSGRVSLFVDCEGRWAFSHLHVGSFRIRLE